MLEILIFLSVSALFIFTWSFWNRKRGNGHKTLALVFMLLSLFLIQQLAFYIRSGSVIEGFYILGLLATDAAFLLLLFRPEWGAIFPQKLNTVSKSMAPFVREVATFLAGYQYDNNAAENELKSVFWKMTGWVGRIGLYGLPLSVVHCFIVGSIAPVFIWLAASLFVGFIYARSYITRKLHEDWTAQSEVASGAYIAFVLAVTLI